MIHCPELNKNFASQGALFAALKANKQMLVDAKKAAIKHSDPILCGIPAFKTNAETVKAVPPADLGYGDYIYPVINTINYLDSHKDLHVYGIWDKSVKDQAGKTYYIVNHDLSIGSVISYPKDVEPMVKEMTWAELGKSYSGKTQVLIFKAKLTEKSNPAAYLAIKDGEDIQNSVRMMYVSLELAINSGHEDYKAEKRIWDKYYPVMVNKEACTEDYFWVITEAKIYKEGSAVLFGSNDATPVQYEAPKHIEPVQTTQKAAAKGTAVRSELNRLLQTLKA